jgi:O-phosphoseryl-tRNA(Cys) synthetase
VYKKGLKEGERMNKNLKNKNEYKERKLEIMQPHTIYAIYNTVNTAYLQRSLLSVIV